MSLDRKSVPINTYMHEEITMYNVKARSDKPITHLYTSLQIFWSI